ncbi:MAG TPA: hypothetical protein DC017_07775 [Candidatus Wallbacteria bacterium]|nr:hypothetical protein [Candidatus Wallbacteria bacterium]
MQAVTLSRSTLKAPPALLKAVLLISLIVVACASNAAFAATSSTIIPTLPEQRGVRPSGFGEAGTRPIGMGEAYVAISDDASGFFWNPAGLAFLKQGKRVAEVMVKANDRNSTTYDSIALTGSVYSDAKKSEFSIQQYLESNLKSPVYDKQLNYNYGVGGIFTNQYGGVRINNFVFGVGKKIDKVKGLATGTKIRVASYTDYMNAQNQMEAFTEFSAGVGAIYEVNKYLKAGVNIDNIIKNSRYELPACFTMGLALNIAEGTVIAMDGYNLIDTKNILGKTEFRAGVEKSFMDNAFTIRLGTKNGNLNLGFGMQFTPEFHFDYAFMGDYDTNIQQHFVSGNIRF